MRLLTSKVLSILRGITWNALLYIWRVEARGLASRENPHQDTEKSHERPRLESGLSELESSRSCFGCKLNAFFPDPKVGSVSPKVIESYQLATGPSFEV